MSPDDYADLVDALLEHVSGLTGQTAAVVLLVEHGMWLSRPAFQPFIQHGRCRSTAQPMATIR